MPVLFSKSPHRSLLLCLLFAVVSLLMPHLCQAQTIIDQDGQKLHFDKPFSRIISLYPAHTENLFSLGLGKEIIGVSKNDDYPTAAQAKPKFNFREDPERFIAAKPDLVIVRPMISRSSPELIAKLRLMGIQAISLQPNTLDETFSYWQTLGALSGREQQATEMITRFKAKLREIETLVQTIPPDKRKRVYFEAIHSKMKTFAPNSMAIFALTTAGGINVASDAEQVRETNIAFYGTERLLAKANDIDLFLAQQGRMNDINEQTIYEEPGFNTIKAVKERQVFLIEENLVARPTLRMIDGIIKIGKILYPEQFGTAFPD
ncbi:MAG: ABC transporter substrate-binding protein [Desulfobulbaceae bacterium]|nr:ABC transporter substrate-binding protein [Desulfobulbaceae bacterium]